ncbi:hypothetical protein ACYTTR_00815 [Cobetia marina]
MKKACLILSFVCLLPGCTTVSYNGGERIVERISYPKVGEVVTAEIGDHMVQKGHVTEVNVLKVNKRIDGFLYDIPAKTYQQVGYDSKNDYYEPSGIIRSALSDPYQALSVERKYGAEICVVTTFGNTACYPGDFEKNTQLSTSDDSFQQTLIYNGRVGNRINIGYREFSNNLARPAFNNEVEYDLSESVYIGYKGAKIEIIDAGNSSVTYKLLSNFPD